MKPNTHFWLIATIQDGREFRLKIKRCWLFGITLQDWPVPVGKPALPAGVVHASFLHLLFRPSHKPYLGVLAKITRWCLHFSQRHKDCRIRCEGQIDLNPERTRQIQRRNRNEELNRLLPELKRLLNLVQEDQDPVLSEGRSWVEACLKFIAPHRPPERPPPANPSYTPAQIAEGRAILEDYRRGGWLKM